MQHVNFFLFNFFVRVNMIFFEINVTFNISLLFTEVKYSVLIDVYCIILDFWFRRIYKYHKVYS